MLPLFLGEWYPWFVLLFAFPFVWSSTILVNLRDTLVATIGFSVCASLEMYLGVFEQTKVMSLAFSKVCTNDLFVLLVNR